jgi:hypothetical protein
MIKPENNKEKFFYIQNGNWSSVVSARDRSSALKDSFRECLKDKDSHFISPIVTVLDIDQCTKDLVLEDALKFLPVFEAAEEAGEKDLSDSLKSIFRSE